MYKREFKPIHVLVASIFIILLIVGISQVTTKDITLVEKVKVHVISANAGELFVILDGEIETELYAPVEAWKAVANQKASDLLTGEKVVLLHPNKNKYGTMNVSAVLLNGEEVAPLIFTTENSIR